MEDSVISQLESLATSWKEQFDNPPTLPFHWEVDSRGILKLNGNPICLAENIIPGEESFGPESLCLNLKRGWVDIIIEWPHRDDPYFSKAVSHWRVS